MKPKFSYYVYIKNINPIAKFPDRDSAVTLIKDLKSMEYQNLRSEDDNLNFSLLKDFFPRNFVYGILEVEEEEDLNDET